jgi:hypothetical protein
VQGVTINILQSSDGETDSLNVENDQEATKTLIADFVKSYNALVTMFDKLTAFNQEIEVAAPLLGDATVRGIRDQIRRELSEAVTDPNAAFNVLRDVGIEVKLDGQMQINDTELSAALGSDFAKLGQLFALTYDDLRAMAQHEAELPIACVEGWSTSQRWRGVRVRDLVAAAGGERGRPLTVVSMQDSERLKTSEVNEAQAVDPDLLLALEVGGEVLHADHGFPARLIGPNRPGVQQTKWVGRIEVS